MEGSPELGFECWKDPLDYEIETTIFPPALITFHEDQFISIMSGAWVGLWLIILIYMLFWVSLITLWRWRLRRSLTPMIPQEFSA